MNACAALGFSKGSCSLSRFSPILVSTIHPDNDPVDVLDAANRRETGFCGLLWDRGESEADVEDDLSALLGLVDQGICIRFKLSPLTVTGVKSVSKSSLTKKKNTVYC